MKSALLFMVLFLLVFSGCEKIIYVDLNTTNPKLIVEANVTDQHEHYIVRLSHSVNYYDPNVFPAVTGAHVFISDNAGNSEALTEVGSGVYQTSALLGEAGRTYTLKIITPEGNEYDGTSTMPARVAIDSVNFQPNRDGTNYRVICKFKDPEGISNYYKLQLITNDTDAVDSTDIRIVADGFADGQELSLTYRTRLSLGDSVTVSLECIDKTTYDFYRTLPDVEGGIRSFISAPPANPVSNINNGALGYFSAHSVSVVSTVVH